MLVDLALGTQIRFGQKPLLTRKKRRLSARRFILVRQVVALINLGALSSPPVVLQGCYLMAIFSPTL